MTLILFLLTGIAFALLALCIRQIRKLNADVRGLNQRINDAILLRDGVDNLSIAADTAELAVDRHVTEYHRSKR